MPAVLDANGLPTCCGYRLQPWGACAFCGKKYDMDGLQRMMLSYRGAELRKFTEARGKKIVIRPTFWASSNDETRRLMMGQQWQEWQEFSNEVEAEVERAVAKFPAPDGLMTALTEEVGEVAKAVLDEPWGRVRKECVQVAAMALRLALEGDPTLRAVRLKRSSHSDDMPKETPGPVSARALDKDRMKTQTAEFSAMLAVTNAYLAVSRCPIVDDDYPEVRHRYEGAVRALIEALKANRGTL